MRSRKQLIAYAAGPGDVISTFHHWIKDESDPHEVSETYSGQFYRQIKALSMTAYVISSSPRRDAVNENWITIEHRPKNYREKAGVSYHLADLWYWLGIIQTIVRSKADIAVISDMEHWWLLSLLRLANVKVIPTLHCTFWPKGHRPLGIKDRVLQTFNGLFWRFIPEATISISPECENQVRELASNKVKGTLLQARPYYRQGDFDEIPSLDWNQKPFALLFAGRIERNKGIFDLLDLAERLADLGRGDFVLELCGTGSAEQELISEIDRRKLSDSVRFLGKLDRHDMRKAYARAHVTLVPTTAEFAEGLNKTVVESILAMRPVVASDICPAVDLMKESSIEVPAGDIDAMVKAIIKLASDHELYDRLQKNCKHDAGTFYDFDQSWGKALQTAITTPFPK